MSWVYGNPLGIFSGVSLGRHATRMCFKQTTGNVAYGKIVLYLIAQNQKCLMETFANLLKEIFVLKQSEYFDFIFGS